MNITLKMDIRLEWYYKEGEDSSIVGEELLTKVPQTILKQLVSELVDKDDPHMAYVYRVPQHLLDGIQPYISHKLDTNQYEYFVCSYQEDTHLWKLLSKVIKNLENNKDLKLLNSEHYVVGYIYRHLSEFDPNF